MAHATPVNFQDRVHQLKEGSAQTRSDGIQALPTAVEALVDNKAYLPRHRKLQREHGDEILLKLAELAQTKGKPSRWYATVTSTKNWDRTLKMVRKLLAAAKRAALVMEKLGEMPEWTKWYTGVTYRNSEAKVAGWLELAIRGRNPIRYFKWLAARPTLT